MKKTFLIVLLFIHKVTFPQMTSSISEDLLLNARYRQSNDSLYKVLSEATLEEFFKTHTTDKEQKTFWINVYNALVLDRLHKQPELYEKRMAFYSTKCFNFCGKQLSLNHIEHNILRRGHWLYGLGYIRKPFQSSYFKKLRMDSIDPRIHFALNCGAASCPPIAFYKAMDLDAQLESATLGYISSEVEWDTTNNTLYIPKIFRWYTGDFGGRKGIRKLIAQYSDLQINNKTKLKYKSYDLSLMLENYLEK